MEIIHQYMLPKIILCPPIQNLKIIFNNPTIIPKIIEDYLILIVENNMFKMLRKLKV